MSTSTLSVRQLMDAGCHFGHTRGRRHPAMRDYIYLTREKVNIINLEKTLIKLDELLTAIENFTAAGQTLILVGTKRQAKDTISTLADQLKLPYVSERWLGGTLTNFETVKKSIRKMNELREYLASTHSAELTKRERLMQSRDLDRMELKFGGLATLTDLPGGLFVVDPSYEKNAVKEARSLGLTVFALLDTNSNPMLVDEFVPANDDASKSIMLIMNEVAGAIERGRQRATAAAATPSEDAANDAANDAAKK